MNVAKYSFCPLTKLIKHNLFKFLGFLFVYPLSLIIPRKKTLWVFGSNFGFADNPKYLYYCLKDNHPELKAVWIYRKASESHFFRSKGVDAYFYKSIRGFIYTMFAGVYVYSFRTSDINYYTSGGAIKVELWHGIAMKEVEFRIKKGRVAYRYNGSILSRYRYPILYQKPDVLLNVGPRYFEILRESFKVEEEKCIIDMYPRCVQFFEDKNKQIERLYKEGGDILTLYKRFGSYRKVYLYMPTFRDTNRNLFEEIGFDFVRLNKVLLDSKSLLIIKVHPNTFNYIRDLADYSNIYFIKRQYDIYPILPFISTLITDYSSIYFDVLLLKKEILLFPFDKNEYQNGDRELVFDYDKDIVGRRVTSFDEFIQIVMEQQDLHLKEKEYKMLIDAFWGTSDSYKDIVNEVKMRYSIL